MESFGQQLKSLREQKGLSIQEVSEKTKIAIANLELLEKDRYELLPPEVFVKGFIRSYAQCLGVNQDEMVKRFEHYVMEGEPVYHPKEDESFFMQKQKRPLWSKTIFTVVLTTLGILSLVILLLTGFTRLLLNDSSEQDAPVVKTVQPKDGKGLSETEKNPDVFRADNGFDVLQPGQDGKKVLEIRSISQAWVRVTPDSGPAHDLVMAPGDVQVFTANEKFHIMTGNAGGIRLKYDGQLLPVLGKENQTVTKRLP
jgi:cytoskeletal protein RodZ